MRRISIVALLAVLLTADCPGAESKKSTKPAPPPARPHRDPPDMPFRCAPMSAAVRSIHIPVGENLHVAFDSELLRTHVVWRGAMLNLWGPPYHERKDRFYCDFEGEVLFSLPPVYPWSNEAEPRTLQTKLDVGARFLGVSTSDGVTRLRYEVPQRDGKPVEIEETSRFNTTGDWVRELRIAPHRSSLWWLAHAAPEGESLQSESKFIRVLPQFLALTETRWREAKNDSEREQVAIRGAHQLAWAEFPASEQTSSFSVVTKRVSGGVALSMEPINETKPLGASAKPAVVFNAPPSPVIPAGNAHYRLERFALPPEIDLQVTGLDFLPNGDAIACTWSGEVYVIEGATGSPGKIRYRRFARGLCEPGGLRVVDGEIFVVQKHELTRLRDTDGNGEADQFDCINNRWGFTGNYHDFTFGPTIDGQGRWHIFRNGNRGHYDVPLMGWDIIVGFDGGMLTPFCAGLRSPNGFGAFEGDVFMTENQGNWMGACKLNHFQEGRFYGFPSTTPAPKATQFDAPARFDPPAVWFPYNLSRSASGIAVIEDNRFGPFKGQMLVGEFQNALVTRVFLERVNGEWQGCVWPFAKGFNSGVNRIAFGPDGKLYVGGVKNAAWSAVVPKNWSLDRLSFTGNVPFEVKEVRAKPDGFELEFTQAVDPESAGTTDNYDITQFRYEYHQTYGSPQFDFDGKSDSSSEVKIESVTLGGDGRSVRLQVAGWRAGHVAAIRLLDVTDASGRPVLHDTFHYTLNAIPSR